MLRSHDKLHIFQIILLAKKVAYLLIHKIHHVTIFNYFSMVFNEKRISTKNAKQIQNANVNKIQ